MQPRESLLLQYILRIFLIFLYSIDVTSLRRFDCNDLATTRTGSGGTSPSNVDRRSSLGDCLRRREAAPEPEPIIAVKPREEDEDKSNEIDEEEEDEFEKRFDCNDLATTRTGSGGTSPSNVDRRASLGDCLRRREPAPAPAPEPAPEPEDRAKGDVRVVVEDIAVKRFDCNALSATRFGSGGASPANVGKRSSLADCV